jgi:peptidoglycan-associated lipoprotein
MKNVAVAFTLTLALTACASTKKATEGTSKPVEKLYSLDRANAIRTMHENFERVRFEHDSSQITVESREALSANVELMRRFPDLSLEVEGHCDERGSSEYNLALGQRRADAIQKYMVLSGIAARRIATISYGEEIPFAFAETTAAYAENRRAEFRIMIDSQPGVAGTVMEAEPIELSFGDDEEEQLAAALE